MHQSINQSINIMTSADENLMPFITVQILSIIDSLPSEVKINYFLLYDMESNRELKLKHIENLQVFSDLYNNLTFDLNYSYFPQIKQKQQTFH